MSDSYVQRVLYGYVNLILINVQFFKNKEKSTQTLHRTLHKFTSCCVSKLTLHCYIAPYVNLHCTVRKLTLHCTQIYIALYAYLHCTVCKLTLHCMHTYIAQYANLHHTVCILTSHCIHTYIAQYGTQTYIAL